MIKPLDEALGFHAAALALRARRQEVLAANVANADTPNFKARDIDFARSLEAALGANAAPGKSPGLMRTASLHLQGLAAPAAGATLLYRQPLQSSADGNTVEMDAERAKFADNALHYDANLTLLSMQIKQILSAIQG